MNEFKNLVSNSYNQSTSKKSKLPASGAMQKKEQQNQFCGCGEVNVPMIKGYCMKCIKKLKDRYDQLLTEFSELQEEQDEYNKIDNEKANEKMKLMQAKAEQYEIKLSDVQMLDVMDRHQKIADSEENRSFAERKVLIQSMR